MSDFDKLADILESKGSGVGKNDDPSQVTGWVDYGYLPLNAASSGDYERGAPQGRIIEIIGGSSAGKTFLATHLMIDAQKAGGIACFNDHERSFSDVLGAKNGLSLERGRWIYKKPETYEESLEIFGRAVSIIRESKIIPADAPIVYVFDSLAAMIPQSQMSKDASALNMNDTTALARLTSQTMKVVAVQAEKFNVTVIFLNQIREKPNVIYGDNTTTPGGNALKYYASQRIRLASSKITKGTGESKEVIGNEVTAVFVKNKVSRPFKKVKWRVLFQQDGSVAFDVIGSTIEFMLANDLLEKGSQGRVVWEGKTLHKDALIEKIKEAGGVEVLNKIIRAASVKTESDNELAAAMEAEEQENARRELDNL